MIKTRAFVTALLCGGPSRRFWHHTLWLLVHHTIRQTPFTLSLVMEAAFSSTSSLQPLATDPSLLASAPLTTALTPRVEALPFAAPAHAASLLFLDPSVSNYQSLLAGVQPGTEVHVLNSAQDAITQITQTLLGRTGITSLHIVSHGQAGSLALGNHWLSLDNLSSYSSALQSWGNALTADADILLYGCDVAQGAIGHAFVEQLAQLTGADIAASENLTGSSALGSDWDLEVNTGDIAAPLAFLPITRQGYSGVLDEALFAQAKQLTSGALGTQPKTIVDGAGNVYITGTFSGTVDFDPGAGTTNLTSAGSDDIFISKLDAGGNLLWAKRLGGSSDEEATGISVDGSGNVYTTGNFSGTADFDPGTDTTNLTSTGGTDIFVSKLDADGNFLWAKSLGGRAFDFATSISVDSSGNVYTTGTFFGTVDFDPGTDTTNLTSAGSDDIFISKLDAGGNFLWAKRLGGSSSEEAIGISVDGSGNVYTTGTFFGTVDFDPGTDTTNLTSAGSYDIFVSKLDTNGNFAWAKRLGGSENDVVSGISVDGSGNVYTTGTFNGTADFDPGAGTINLTSVGAADIFISKLNADGTFLWVKRLGGDGHDRTTGISVDSSGNVYTTGTFNGTADFDPGVGTMNLTSWPGYTNIFVSKLDVGGNFLWARSLSSTFLNEAVSGISVDGSGNVYTTGTFLGTVDFDPGAGTFNLDAGGVTNLFLSKLDTTGNFVQAQQLASSALSTQSIVVDGAGNVYITGAFSGTVDFDPGAGTTNLSSTGGGDIFVSKLDASGNFLWARNLGGSGSGSAIDISVDSSGNVYTTGNFYGTVDFDPGTGTTNLSSEGNGFDTDVFVSKLDAGGNFVWARSLGGSSDDRATGISVDSSGNVYTTGTFYGTVDFDPGTGTTNLSSASGYDIFVSKLDTGGNFLWAKSVDESSGNRFTDISVDSSGNVYTTGTFYGTVDFDPGESTTNLTSAGSDDIFISKLDAGGNFLWARSLGSNFLSGAVSGISVDSSGNVYTTGTFYGTVDFDPGEGTTNLTSTGGTDIFVSKLDAGGGFVWAKSLGGSSDDRATGISVDGSGNVYTTGSFTRIADFDPGTETFKLTSGGTGFDTDIFVSKLDAGGGFVWAKSLGGSSDDRATGISVDGSGNVYTTGTFIGTVDFDPGVGTFNLATGGTTNTFLSKLSQVLTPRISLGSSAVSLNEGNSGNTAYTFTVNLSNTSAETVTVNYTTVDGTATVADGDYTAASSTLTFNPGETSKTITVFVKGDSKVEQDETFLVQLLNPTHATLAPNADMGTGTIVNDDARPTINITPVISQNEGNNGTTAYTFTASLSNTSDETITVNYATADGTATVADGDYTATSGTLSFAPGVTSQTFTVLANGDTRIEQNETFVVNLTAPTNATITIGTGTGTIVNDDAVNLLWRNTTTSSPATGSGANVLWQMHGFTRQSGVPLPTVGDLNWQIVGSADFNGDGSPDLLWRNGATGENTIWLMNGVTRLTGTPLTTVGDLNWQVASTADFNHDGKADILWRNRATGANTIWELNGTVHTGHALTTVGDLNWQLVSTADFNADGTTDLLWRNRSTGENVIWQMNNFSRQTRYDIPTVGDLNWQIVGAGDFNHDGIADLVWRNQATGANSIWQMNGTGRQSGYSIRAADLNWQLAGVADLDGDGVADLLWRNQSAGKEVIWQLNGFSYAQTYQLPSVASSWLVKTLPSA